MSSNGDVVATTVVVTTQRRMLAAVVVASVLALGVTMAVGAAIVQREDLRRFDQTLTHLATDAAERAVAPNGQLTIAGAPPPAYGAVYDEQGTPQGSTAAFAGEAPRSSVLHPAGEPFDLLRGDLRLRAVMVPIVGRPSASLLLATPRDDLQDGSFRGALAGLLVVAFGFALIVSGFLIGRLARAHREVAGLRAELDAQWRFVADAAHELRAPLTIVHGQLALALRRPRHADEYRSAIGEALDAASHLRTLTEDLLDLERARGDKGRVEPIAIARLARVAARRVQPVAQARLVTIEVRGVPAVVLGRAADLERLVRNLLENAVRHSPPGGQILVEVTERAGDVQLAVTDEGSGVAAAERDRLFEPFFRGAGTRDEPGAGLGLAIAREVARAHGGDLRLDPSSTRGARFVVDLHAVTMGDTPMRPVALDRAQARPDLPAAES